MLSFPSLGVLFELDALFLTFIIMIFATGFMAGRSRELLGILVVPLIAFVFAYIKASIGLKLLAEFLGVSPSELLAIPEFALGFYLAVVQIAIGYSVAGIVGFVIGRLLTRRRR